MSKRMWLVYEQNESYEGGDVPLLVAGSEKASALAVARINAATRKLSERLLRLPDPLESHIDDDEQARRWDLRERAIARMRWPFGLKREQWSFSHLVKAKPLPFTAEVH